MKQLIQIKILAAILLLNGCQTTLPSISEQNSDQIILTAEKAAETAKLTFSTLVNLERDNEAMLKTVNPQIHVYANTIRAHGIDWIVSLRDATKTFKANRTQDNRASLNTILATLLAAIGDTNKLIAQSKSAVGH